MLASLRRHGSPSLVISALALFFALGGSALAVKERSEAASPYQKRCATGAVKGIAVVTGDPKKGIENLPTEFSTAPVLFGARWSCTGGTVQVRSGAGGTDVRFPGNAAGTAVVSPYTNGLASASVFRTAEGFFHVTTVTHDPIGTSARRAVPFVIVAS